MRTLGGEGFFAQGIDTERTQGKNDYYRTKHALAGGPAAPSQSRLRRASSPRGRAKLRSVSFLRRSLAPRFYEEGCPGAVPKRIATVALLLRNDSIIEKPPE